MHQYNAEAFVSATHAHRIAEDICRRSEVFCRSIVHDSVDKLLDFDGGRAIIRPADEGLLFLVSARDLVTFYGIRALLEGILSKFIGKSISSIEWLPAGGILFRETDKRIRDDRHTEMKSQ